MNGRVAALSLLLPSAVIAALSTTPGPQDNLPARPDPDALSRAVLEMERLDALRSALAGGFDPSSGPPDRTTFQEVCRPVGERAGRIAAENGWMVRQLSERYRNPAHEADPEARRVLRRMGEDGTLMGLWMRAEVDGRPGHRYYRRIIVEPACLACHGARNARPDFVRKGYPADRAYGFEPSDLRGVYSVFVPDPR
jgi:hypothetical protein